MVEIFKNEMNKRGLIKIVEAVLAVMIILTVVIISYGEKKEQESNDFAELARDILNEAANNNDVRSEIIGKQTFSPALTPITDTFISGRVPVYLNYEARACEVSSACGQSAYQGEVYSAERVFSATNTLYDPIKLRLFLWEKT